MRKESRFGVVGYFEQVLGYRFRRIRAATDLNQFRVMHELPGQSLDFSGKGGGKEQRLTLAGEKSDNLSDGWYKAHIEHAVGLIQNQELEGSKALLPSANQIEKPSWGSDNQINALLQGPNLRPFTDSSKNRGNP
jgi:hypothetical protein